MSYLPSSPDLANIAGMLAKYPGRGILLYKLLQDIKGSGSPISKGIRELIVTYTSVLNNCDFCYKTHKAVSAEFGIDDSVFEQLRTDIDSADVDDKLKPVLRFVKKLTLTPDEITPADAQYIFDAGWDEQAFLDSVFLCAIVNCMNRFVMGTGVDVDSSPVHRMKTNGWEQLLEPG